MARVDSLIFFLAGFAQLIVASEVETLLISTILQGTGGGTLALGVYFLIFVARNHKEFSDRYSKSEKTVLVRDPETGKLIATAIDGSEIVALTAELVELAFKDVLPVNAVSDVDNLDNALLISPIAEIAVFF